MNKLRKKINVRTLKKYFERVIILTLIFSWSFSPIVPALKIPALDNPVKLGLEVKKAQAVFGNGYTYRRAITIDPNMVSGGSNLTDFPVLMSFTDPTFRTTANGGNFTDVTGTVGQDFIFTSDSDGATTLDYETERYNATTGELNAWVRVPTLDTTSNTIVYMFYGNSSVTTSQENITGTWDTNYKEVLHMSETSGQHLDSTSNNNDSTSVSVATQGSAQGKIAGADDFNGTSNSVTVPDSATLDLTNTGTIEAWMKTDDVNGSESNFSTWVARNAPNGAGADDQSGIDSVIVGENIHYGAFMCDNGTGAFGVATSTLSGNRFDNWDLVKMTVPTGCPATATAGQEGGVLGMDSDGVYIYYAALAVNNATESFQTATATPTYSSVSTWRNDTDPNGAGSAEGNGVDMVIVGNTAYYDAVLLNGTTETFASTTRTLGSGAALSWQQSTATDFGGAANTNCSNSIDSDGDKLYRSILCNPATEVYNLSSTTIDTNTPLTWRSQVAPNGSAASEFGGMDMAAVGGRLLHFAGLHAGTTEAFSTASSSMATGGVLSWVSRQDGSGNPNGTHFTAGDSQAVSVASDGKNVYYGAYIASSTAEKFFTASSTLPAHPFVSKLNAYEMIQVGTGYAFDWAGRPYTFGTSTNTTAFDHVVITQDGTTLNMYENGVLRRTQTTSVDFESNANNLLIGAGNRSDGTAIYFDGVIDEVRISSTARSADWINTEYNNQNSTSTFYTLGAETGSIVNEPKIYSSSNQRFSIGQSSTTMLPINIFASTTPGITTTNDIRIAIATTSGFHMEWDTTITTATVSGSASGKVSTTVSYPSPSELFITVTSDFASEDSLTISGLKYRNFTSPAHSGTGAFLLYTSGSTAGLAAATSTDLVTIGTTGAAGNALNFKINKPPNYLSTGNDLVGYWTFDGKNMYQNVKDSSSQGNNGSLISGAGGNTSTTTVPGKIGQALNFDGTDDYVVTNSASFSAGDFSGTVCAWTNFASVAVENTIMSEGDTTSLRGFGIFVGSTPGIISVAYYGAKNVNTNNIVSANTWNHICVTKSPGGIDTTTTIYLNGVSQTIASANTGTPNFLATNPVFIGVDRVSNGTSQSLTNGSIDELRIYNRALSAEEIGFIYRSGSARVSKSMTETSNLTNGLVGWWTFDGKNMYQNVQDISGRGNNGSLIIGASGSNTSTSTVPGKIGQALNFDGTDDYIDIADSDSMSFGNGTTDTPLTISAWVYMRNAVEFKILKKGGTTGATLEYFFRTGDQGTNTDLLTFRVYDASANANLGRRYSVSMTGYQNRWIFLTATYDGSASESGVALYIDGARVDDVSASSGVYVAMENLTTGAQIARYNTFFSNGLMDDVRLYGRALSSREIVQLYNYGRSKIKI